MASTSDLVDMAGSNMETGGQNPNYSEAWLEMLAASGVPSEIANQAVYNNFGQDALPAIAASQAAEQGQQGGVPATIAPTQPGAKVGASAGTAVPAASGAPSLNVGYGSDFVQPLLQLLGQIYGIGENARQFDTTAAFTKAQQLASLSANPLSAYEAAALRAQLGLGGTSSAADIMGLLSPSTVGASGQQTPANPAIPAGQAAATPGTSPEAGTPMFGSSIPNTLSGGQMAQLEGNPTGAGVLQSFATAGGNPDILKRSLAALLPAGFQSVAAGIGA